MSGGWSREELKASVDAYQKMLAMHALQQPFVKAQVYRDLALRFGRKEGAFERRMQNISAIYKEFGLEWLPGLKPQHNIGNGIKPTLIELIGLPGNQGVAQELEAAAKEAEYEQVFDPENVVDARKRVVASIVRRRGQGAFRNKLLKAYNNTCAITGCQQVEVLEAAHIHPYRGEQTHAVSNGLLLRADLHTLFDLYLIAIDPKTRQVRIAPELSQSDYARYEGLSLPAPLSPSAMASIGSLQWHAEHCAWLKSPSASLG